MEYMLKIVPEKNGCRYLLCDPNGNYFALSKMTYDILSKYRQTSCYAATLAHLKGEYPNLSETDIESAINSTFSIISKSTKARYIFTLFHIVKAGKGATLYKVLKWLFHPIVLPLLLVTALIATSSYYYITPKNISSLDGFSLTQIPIYYGLFLLILLFHEVGHATAAYYYGIRPKEIGFGFYIIFPVFFTNVSGAWELNASKRTIVNIGGIYFQLLINLLLIILMLTDVFTDISQRLFLINSISILVCLIPFLRYDGYWIISDLCKIPNLRKKTHDLMVYLIASPSAARMYISKNKVSPQLVIYVALYAVFWALLYLFINQFIATSFMSILEDHTLSDHNPNKAVLHAEKLLILFCLSIIVSLVLYRFLKSICHAKKKQLV